jgi:tight adherence protein C
MALAVLLAAFFAAGILMVFIGLSQRAQAQAVMQRRLRRAVQGSPTTRWGRPLSERLLHPLGSYLSGHTEQRRVRGLQMRLAAAGRPYNLTVPRLLALKALIGGFTTIVMAAFLLQAGVVFLVFPRVVSAIILAVLVGLVGYFAPDLWLMQAARDRREAMRRQLPDVCDLISVFVDAAAPFDLALERLVASPFMAGPLIDELETVVHSYELGTGRSEALHLMAERIRVEEVTSFVNAVTRSFRQGTRISDVMRVQAADIRRRYRERAEEKANRAGVKMLFPLVFLIFPTLFLVILTPALISALGTVTGPR